MPVFDPVTFDLLRWAADYYHHPVGEVFAAALPASLRDGQPAVLVRETWRLTAPAAASLAGPTDRRAPKRRALLAWLAEQGPASPAQIAAAFDTSLLRALAARGWAARESLPEPASPEETSWCTPARSP